MANTPWFLVAMLASAPALAGSVDFQGHSVEVDATTGARRVLSVRGASYSIPGSTAQAIGKAQSCLARADSGVGVVSVDPSGGRLRAVSRTGYQHGGLARVVRSRWAIEAAAGSFRVILTDMADVSGDGVGEIYAPLLLDGDSGGGEALAAVIDVGKSLLDCMYR